YRDEHRLPRRAEPLHRRMYPRSQRLLRRLPANRRRDRGLAGDGRRAARAPHGLGIAGARGAPRLMVGMPADAAQQAALGPLSAGPAGPAWNLDELSDLLPAHAALADAAVLVPLVGEGETSVILTRRHDGLRQHGGQVSFPGGRVDPGDAGPLAAALREADEEIGLRPADARVLGYLDPLATVSGFRVLPVVARVPAGFEPRPRPGEVAEVFSLPLAW